MRAVAVNMDEMSDELKEADQLAQDIDDMRNVGIHAIGYVNKFNYQNRSERVGRAAARLRALLDRDDFPDYAAKAIAEGS